MQDLNGQKLGQYEIIRELGHGGMANVYLARQQSIGREVAIKVLPPHFLQDRTFLERFNREVQVIARLQHPRILPVIDFGEHDNMPYIVMAYMSGGTLADLIRSNNGGLPLDQVSRLAAQITEGLDYAHEKGIIHRDFKPSNVLLDEKGNAHLADFGIAKITADTAQLTGSGIVGTPSYMAPEMSRSGGVTPLVDVYAMGVTLFQMLTGRQPYEADTPIGIMMAHATEPVPDVTAHRKGLPGGVQQVIERAMSKEPSARYPTPGDVSADFTRTLEGQPVSALSSTPAIDQPETLAILNEQNGLTTPVAPPHPPTPPPPTAAPQPGKKPSRVPLAIGGVVLLALLAIGLVVILSPKTDGGPGATAVPGGGSDGGGSTAGTSGGGKATAAPIHNAATAAALQALPGRIYFTSDRDGDFEIFSVKPDGSDLTQLTSNTSTDNYPDVSSDGQMLLFITDREEASSDQLYVMSTDGSAQERIRYNQLTYGESPRYSPVGTKVVFSTYDNTADLIIVHILDLADGSIIPLIGGDRDEQWNPDFSPDGQKVVYYLEGSDSDAQIHIVNVDGTGDTQITQSGANRFPTWSPDGRKILYVADDGGIYMINIDGTDQTRLADGSWADWSPDGQYIVYSSYVGETGLDQIYVMTATGGGQTQVLQSAAKDMMPVWGK